MKTVLLQVLLANTRRQSSLPSQLIMPVGEQFPRTATHLVTIDPQSSAVVLEDEPGKGMVAFIQELYCNYYEHLSKWSLQIDQSYYENYQYYHAIGTPDAPEVQTPPLVCQQRIRWTAWNDSIDESLCFECYAKGVMYSIPKFLELNLRY